MIPAQTPNWNELYDDFARVSQREASLSAEAEAAQRARQDFEQWTEYASFKVMNEISDLAKFRARELLERTGLRVEVGAIEAHGDASLKRAPQTLHLPLTRNDTCVYLYASRGPSRPPYIHFGYFSGSPGSAGGASRKRFITLPGVALLRSSPSEIALRDATTPNRLGLASSAEALVFRAFGLLARRSGPSAVRLTR